MKWLVTRAIMAMMVRSTQTMISAKLTQLPRAGSQIATERRAKTTMAAISRHLVCVRVVLFLSTQYPYAYRAAFHKKTKPVTLK